MVLEHSSDSGVKSHRLFTFGILVVEVFTSKIPFKEQMNAVAVFHILYSDWLKILKDAQVVGLSSEAWRPLGAFCHGYHLICHKCSSQLESVTLTGVQMCHEGSMRC